MSYDENRISDLIDGGLIHEKQTMETLYRKVADKIKYCKDNGEDLNSASWGQQEGVIISANEAEEWLSTTAQLQADKAELLEALEKKKEYLEEIGMMVPSEEWTEQFRDRWNLKLHEIESLIQKMKP